MIIWFEESAAGRSTFFCLADVLQCLIVFHSSFKQQQLLISVSFAGVYGLKICYGICQHLSFGCAELNASTWHICVIVCGDNLKLSRG